MNSLQPISQQQPAHDVDRREGEKGLKRVLAEVGIITGTAGGGLGAILAIGYHWISTTPSVLIPFVLTALFPFLTLLAIIYQALVYHRQWRVMKDSVKRTDMIIDNMQATLDEQRKLVAQNERAVKAAEDNVETTQRNAIYANRAYLAAKIRNDDPYYFKLAIENGGNTPANNVKVSYTCKVMQDPPWRLDEQTNQVVYDIGFNITVQLGVIAPNGSHGTVQTANFTPRTAPERQEWEDGVKLFCWGWIYYEDIFNEKRHTEFCFYKSLRQPQGHPCDYGNEAF